MNQNDLDWLDLRLSIAIEETRRLGGMSIQDIREFLKADVPGAEELSMTYANNGNQVFHIGDKAVEVGPMASNEEIKAAFLNPFIPTRNTQVTVNPIDRLKEKLAKAAGAGGRVAAKIEAKADALIARESAMEAKADSAFAPHEQVMDAAGEQLDAVENALNQLSNGGPPLNG